MHLIVSPYPKHPQATIATSIPMAGMLRDSAVHMGIVISHLLPHLSRWRSIDILTDTWAPMYVALHQINTNITSFGTPLLESLTLMRCKDVVSYSPQFQPREMKDPVFLTFGADLLTQSRTPCSQSRPWG
jgi:hypothetical protein